MTGFCRPVAYPFACPDAVTSAHRPSWDRRVYIRQSAGSTLVDQFEVRQREGLVEEWLQRRVRAKVEGPVVVADGLQAVALVANRDLGSDEEIDAAPSGRLSHSGACVTP